MSVKRRTVDELFFCVYVEPVHAMYMHHLTHHTQHTSGSPLQLSLPDTRVHYCSLTSTSSQTTAGFSPNVILLWFVATEWCDVKRWEDVRHVCCCLAFLCVWGSVWLYNNSILTPKLSNLCVCMCVCNVSCWGFMCGAVCPQGFSPQWPQRRLSERDRERERKRERECLCCPLTPTHESLFWYLEIRHDPLNKTALSTTPAYSSRLICCNATTFKIKGTILSWSIENCPQQCVSYINIYRRIFFPLQFPPWTEISADPQSHQHTHNQHVHTHTHSHLHITSI